ncbi:MAG: patatin-like phospholipase family protein, partial [Porticoccaceae bacterium]
MPNHKEGPERDSLALNDPLGWDEVLARERTAIREPDGQSDGPERPLTGLAFSGGGIRSATFNLGVVQALAELRLLQQFDYLSCVSGGGYVGGWLSAFIRRECAGRVEDAEDKLRTGGTENPAIRFLRSYSNYLTPRSSLLSADTLAAVATYLRNLYLNLSLLLLALSALLLLPRLLMWGIRWLADWKGVHADLTPLFGGGVAALALGILFIGLNISGTTHRTRPFYARQAGVLTLVVLPVVVSAWFIAYGLYAGSTRLKDVALGTWVAGGTLIYSLPWLLGWLGGR